MAGRRSPGTDIREILRRLQQGEPDRRIARDLEISRNTVARCRVWATRHGVLDGGPLPDTATLAGLLERPPAERPANEQSLVEPLRERVLALHDQGVEGQAIEHYGFLIAPCRPRTPEHKAWASYCSSVPHLRCTLRIAAAIPESFPRVGPGKWPGRGFEQEGAFVVDPSCAQDPFAGKPLGGRAVHPKLARDLGRRQPPAGAEVLGHARNPVRLTQSPDAQAGERLAGAGPEPPAIEGVRGLMVGLFRPERADHLDDRRRRAPEIGRPHRPRPVERGRRTPLPANLDPDRLVPAHERHVLDEQPQHPLALPHRCPRIMPHAGEVVHQGVNAGPAVSPHRRPVRGRGPSVLLLGLGEPRQLLVPLAFQAVGHEPVLRTHQHELPLGDLRLFAGARDMRLSEAIDVGFARAEFLEDLQGDVERGRGDRLEHDLADRLVEPGAGDDLADPLRRRDPAPVAHVVGDRMPVADDVADGHPIPAAATEHQALQEGHPFAGRTAAPIRSVAMRIGQERRLIGLELFPGDVAGVGVGQEDLPLRPGQQPIARLPGDRDLALAPAAVHERAGIAGIVEDAQDPTVLQGAEDNLSRAATGGRMLGKGRHPLVDKLRGRVQSLAQQGITLITQPELEAYLTSQGASKSQAERAVSDFAQAPPDCVANVARGHEVGVPPTVAGNGRTVPSRTRVFMLRRAA